MRHALVICVCALYAATADYGTPIEIHLRDSSRTPVTQLVDITNEFGLKVLAEHNFLNENNIAFSPYGLTGILIALYEGVEGESSYQIQRSMQFPWNRNVMRIGFRDIHRTLKTYFIPEEGFLAGLALNNENVTFKDNYKNILRFYGFDLENDQLPTTPTTTTNETGTSMSSTGTDTTSITSQRPTTFPSSTEESTPNPSTLTTILASVPDAQTNSPLTENVSINTTQGQSEMSSTSATLQVTDMSSTSSLQNVLSTVDDLPLSSPVNMETSTTASTLMSDITSTESTVLTSPSQETPISPSQEMPISPSQETPISPSQETLTSQVTQNQPTDDTTINNEVEIIPTSSSPTIENSEGDDTTSTTELPTTASNPSTTTQTSMNDTTLETLERRKKSVVDFIFTNPPYMDDFVYYRSYDYNPELKTNDKMFLANGLRNVHVSYMQYNTVLDYAYLTHLEASALKLPLDSDRYYLLVVLPAISGLEPLNRLISRMARESDLRDVYAALRPCHVRALVPSFTVKGHIALTTDLQRLGIRSVFEPRQGDFGPMTAQTGVYVRSVEQAVTVAIRKYSAGGELRNRYVSNRYPVNFAATYPFLYFVMDSSVHVALMAGKMLDPLNTRIL